MRLPRHTAIVLVCGIVLLSACKERYRVGEYVLVSWCEGEYPAYVLARKGPARYRVHFDGYDDRWDADVGIEDIKQRLASAPEISPPLCEKVARAMGITDEKDSAQSMTYEVGAKVSVTWRGAVYKATIIEVIDRERFRVHYEGHEAAWDEVIDQDRIIKGR